MNGNHETAKAAHLWWTETEYNKAVPTTITLKKTGDDSKFPLYSFSHVKDFFPLTCSDGLKQNVDCGQQHNNLFATHFHSQIVYSKSFSKLTLGTDDDSWVFLNKHLIIDYGGLHAPETHDFNLEGLGFTEGMVYDIDFFHADRCPTEASLTIKGSFVCDPNAPSGTASDADNDGYPDCADLCPTDPERWTQSLSDKGCACGAKNKECYACEDLTTMSVCESHRDLGCHWCYDASAKGKCYSSSHICPCNYKPSENATRCEVYNEKKPYERCDYCTSTKTCVAEHRCKCEDYTTEESCEAAISQKCNWCGPTAQCKPQSKCPGCTEYSDETSCINAFYGLNGDKQCFWCNDSTTGAKCKTECIECDQIKDLDLCVDVVKTYKDENRAYHSEAYCHTCDTNEDNVVDQCTPGHLNCTSCGKNTDKNSCITAKDANGHDLNCNWCNGKCQSEQLVCSKCEQLSQDLCPVYTNSDDAKFCKICSIGPDYLDETMKSELYSCGSLDDNDHSSQNCYSCEEINQRYYENAKASSGIIDLDTLKLECLSQVHTNCYFCGSINYNASRLDQPLPLCVSSPSECPSCQSLETVPPVDEVSTYSSNCFARATSYPFHSTEDKSENELTRCVYCDWSSKCYSLVDESSSSSSSGSSSSSSSSSGSKLFEYNDIKDNETLRSIFIADNYCDVDCHDYAVQVPLPQKDTMTDEEYEAAYSAALAERSKYQDLCYHSRRLCTWCRVFNSSSLDASGAHDSTTYYTCYNATEECDSCSSHATDMLCNAMGCKWCKMYGKCQTSGAYCPSTSLVTGAAIGAGIIAAIVVAVVVALVISSVASKKIYDSIMDARAASMDSATTNPTYTSKEDGGNNPIFE